MNSTSALLTRTSLLSELAQPRSRSSRGSSSWVGSRGMGALSLAPRNNHGLAKTCEKRALPCRTLQRERGAKSPSQECSSPAWQLSLNWHIRSPAQERAARVRTQVTLPLGPGGGRQRLISFPPRAGPNANCLLVPNAIFCTIEHVPYLGQREAKASLGFSLWFEVEV